MIRSTELASFLKTSPQNLNNLRVKEGFQEEIISEKEPIPKDLYGTMDTLKGPRNRYFTPLGVRKILEKRNYPFKKKIVSISNLKGGVGKTSICVHLARMAVTFGFRVLVVDADKQGNATGQLIDGQDFKYCLFNIITKDKNFQCNLEDAIIKVNDFLSVIPSNLNNQRLEMELQKGLINNIGYFSRLFKQEDYDLILIDTEPNLSLVNLMALTSADLNIAPIKLDKNSIDGLQMILGQIEDIKGEWKGVNLKTKVLINGFDGRMKTSLEKIGELQNLGIEAFDSVIRTDNSFVKFQDGIDLPKNSKAYEDIKNLTLELLNLNQVNIQ
jgi:chromosome partitioning protein